MTLSKVTIRKLETKSPPLDSNGGRILTPAGEIAQIVSGNSFNFLAYIEFENSKAPRGNHYHTVKEEFLYVIKGRLRAIYKDIDSGETEEVILETGDLINLKPQCAHVYFALEYTQTLEFSNFPYDPTDTQRYVLE